MEPRHTPRTAEGRAGLAALLADPARALIALDFDGTLSPIVEDPSASRLADGGPAALRGLAALAGQVAVVTGRPAATVVELGGLADVPGLLVEGQYGAERWRAGEVHRPDPPPGLADVRAHLPAILAGTDAGVWTEDKYLSLVVHTRRAGDPDRALADLAGPVRALAHAHGLDATLGRYVIEIRIPGVDKGGALDRLLGEFRPGSVLFAGDDLGDLPAFDVVERRRAGGLPGLTVCSGSAEVPEVARRADLVVDGPDGVVEFLVALTGEASAAG